MRPTVAEIGLESLRHNYHVLQGRLRATAGADAGLLAVIKANAYGHGLALCGRALAGAGAEWLGVTSVGEAEALLAALEGWPQPRVLVMSGFFPGEEEAVLRLRAAPQVWAWWHLERLHRAAQAAGMGPGSVPVHLEIDTGMSRQGVAPGPDLAELLAGFAPGSPVWVEGVLTHFSSPEELENPATEGQLALWRGAMRQVREAGLRPRWVHAGNSAAVWSGRALREIAQLAQENGAAMLARPGLALYGVEPRFTPDTAAPAEEPLRPVMRWVTRVTSIREVAAGTPVGYNETFRAPEGGARWALLPVGYADGLRRELSNRGRVLVRGQAAPIVGRVSMDQTVVDISGMPEVAIGDEVVLLGSQGEEMISAAEIAGLCGTIPYEVLCGVGARVPRVSVADASPRETGARYAEPSTGLSGCSL